MNVSIMIILLRWSFTYSLHTIYPVKRAWSLKLKNALIKLLTIIMKWSLVFTHILYPHGFCDCIISIEWVHNISCVNRSSHFSTNSYRTTSVRKASLDCLDSMTVEFLNTFPGFTSSANKDIQMLSFLQIYKSMKLHPHATHEYQCLFSSYCYIREAVYCKHVFLRQSRTFTLYALYQKNMALKSTIKYKIVLTIITLWSSWIFGYISNHYGICYCTVSN
jgi:hypothetical protein